LARGLLSPFLRGLESLKISVGGAFNLAAAGLEKGLGNKDAVKQEMARQAAKQKEAFTKGTKYGEAGYIKPFGAEAMQDDGRLDTGEAIQTMVGGGVQVASRLLPVGEIAGGGTGAAIAGGKILSAAGRGAASGAVSGAFEGFGAGLVEHKKAKEVVEQTVLGGLVGGVIGGVASGALAATVKGVRGGANIWRRWRSGIQQKAVEENLADQLIGPVSGRPGEMGVMNVAKANTLNPGDVGMVRNASAKELKAMREMQQIAEQNMGVRAPDTLPVEKAGSVVYERIKAVDALRKAAGEKLDEAVLAMPNSPLDISDVRYNLAGDLTSQGVKIRSNGKLDFRGSRYADQRDVVKFLTNLWDDLRPNQNGVVLRTPERIVNIRRGLFDAAALQKDVLSPVEMILEKTSSALDDPLVNISGGEGAQYAVASRMYAQTRTNLTEWYRTLGYKYVEGTGVAADLRIGQVLNRSLGNASAQYVKLLKDTENILGQTGYTSTIDPMTLLRFNDWLEELYGITQTRGHAGSVSKGVKDALAPAAAATKGRIAEAVMSVADKVSGDTLEGQRGALKMLLDFYVRNAR